MNPVLAALRGPARRFLGTGEISATGLSVQTPASSPLWLALLSVWGGLMLVLLALADNASLRGEAWGNTCLWLCIAALVWPFVVRLAWPAVAEQEQLCLLVALGLDLYLVRVLHNPTAFANHDEFLHWRTLLDILSTHHLFSENPLLPISPYYPGLELLTAAVVELTGLSDFAAGALIIGVARVCFVLGGYAFYRYLSASARVAAMATLVTMASSNFIFFHGQFSHESLAVALLMIALVAALTALHAEAAKFPGRLILFLLPCLALTVTHHLTAYFLTLLLGLVTLCQWACKNDQTAVRRLLWMSGLSLGSILLWHALIGDLAGSYLGPILGKAIEGLRAILETGSGGRKLFVSSSGEAAPLWQRFVTLASVAMVGCGLLTGTLRSWPRTAGRHRAWVVVMVLLSSSYPVFVALRLEPSTWEIGNRIGTLVFLATSYIVAVAVVGFWQGESSNRMRTALVGSALTLMIIGGLIAGDGPLVQPGPYLVEGDSRSVEAEGIHAAQWSFEVLGENNVFATDRTNRLLSSVYGHQRVVTSLSDKVDISSIFLQPRLGEAQFDLINRVNLEFLLVDDRLSTQLPFVGHYFEVYEMPGGHKHPIARAALDKFDGMPHVGRIYDGGDIAIYDVRGLHGKQ